MNLPNSFFAELDRIEQLRAQAQTEGQPALQRLAEVAQRDSGQAGIVRRFLLALYNGRAYPFDLTSMRALDRALHDDCMDVLRMDSFPEKEVHEYLQGGAVLFRQFRDQEAVQ